MWIDHCPPVQESLTLHLLPCWYQWVSSIQGKRRALNRNTEHTGARFCDVSRSDIHPVTGTVIILLCSAEEEIVYSYISMISIRF